MSCKNLKKKRNQKIILRRKVRRLGGDCIQLLDDRCNGGLSMKFVKTLHCNMCTLNTITHTPNYTTSWIVLCSVHSAVPNYSQMLRLPAGVSFKSHVRDVAPRLMSVFNFTTSTFDWTIHLEPALDTFLFFSETLCCSFKTVQS